jgi:hypothetical protein
MGLALNRKVIQALAADGADHPLHERVLPACSGGGRHLPDPHLGDAPGEDLAVDRVSIPEEVLRRGLLGEGLDELPRGPAGRGMIRDVDVDEFTAVVAELDEDEQQAKRQGRHEEEIHGDDLSGMRGKKSPPRRGGPRRRPLHVLGNGQLGHGVAEEGEFRLDAAAAPGGILASHAPDEMAKLGVEPRAPD